MGIAYVVVGGICVLLGTLFAIAHLVRPRYGPFFDPYAFFFFFFYEVNTHIIQETW